MNRERAKAAQPTNLTPLERRAAGTGLDIQDGGGIKRAADRRSVYDAGANRAICGSIAVTDPGSFAEWLEGFGTGHIILGADIRDGFVATHGWLEGSGITAEELIGKLAIHGLSQVICTDISKDGMLQGPNFGLYEQLQQQFSGIDITVSGGISSMDDIIKLDNAEMRSVIVGKAIYEGRITIGQLKGFAEM